MEDKRRRKETVNKEGKTEELMKERDDGRENDGGMDA